jgi:ubiquitin C-terminal hydrolase
MDAQTTTGFVGLRNLGLTRYMSAIFQSLFWTYRFRDLVMTNEMREQLHRELQRLSAELLIRKRRLSDTEPFCACWQR